MSLKLIRMELKRKTVFFLIAICLCTSVLAQNTVDKELAALIDIVKLLRASNETNYNKAEEALARDLNWTAMDETTCQQEDKECDFSEGIPSFKLNRILWKVSDKRKHVSTHGDMINGQSTAYDYSLFELALKPQTEARYQLEGRKGQQAFILIPYNKKAKLEMSIVYGQNQFKAQSLSSDGSIIVEWTKNTPVLSDKFELVIKNTSSSPQSFVILNHNTRKK